MARANSTRYGTEPTLTRLIPFIISALLLAAHFTRANEPGLASASLLFPAILLLRDRWVLSTARIMTLVGGTVWLGATLNILQVRLAFGQPWLRMASILTAVALFTIAAGIAFRSPGIRQRYQAGKETARLSTSAFFLTAILLVVIKTQTPLEMLIVDRFFPGYGWLEVLVLAVYAAWLVGKVHDPRQTKRWRLFSWTIFSIIFFLQLGLGLLGFEKFLMTGDLHLPVPAMILVGPLYRGNGYFMPMVFLTAMLIVGPAWCSHLCYIGSWDNQAAVSRKRPVPLPRWRQIVRPALVAIVIGVAILFRLLGVSAGWAVMVAGLFGLGGVLVMLTLSRRTGSMVHCVSYCPIGLLATWLGKISPFRLRLNNSCNDCGACTLSCRYDALNEWDIARRRPDMACTLCGDCIGSCPSQAIEYRFLKLRPDRARALFLVVVVSLHVVFMGITRI